MANFSIRETLENRASAETTPYLFLFSTMNVEKLWSLVSEEARLNAAKDTSVAPVIDVTKRGIFKVSFPNLVSPTKYE